MNFTCYLLDLMPGINYLCVPRLGSHFPFHAFALAVVSSIAVPWIKVNMCLMHLSITPSPGYKFKRLLT